MFDFIFKKRAPAPNPAMALQRQTEQQQIRVREKSGLADKQSELAQAESLAGQEVAALAFVLKSGFADARLVAVKHIENPQSLKQIYQAMRHVDRRVSKYAQEKLAEFDYQQKMQLAVEACFRHGQQLLQLPHLLTNQVSSWDKERLSLGHSGAALLAIKAELEHRLHRQLELQRQVMQVISTLLSLTESTDPVQDMQRLLADCEQQVNELHADRLIESVPRNLLLQLDDSLVQAQAQRSAWSVQEQPPYLPGADLMPPAAATAPVSELEPEPAPEPGPGSEPEPEPESAPGSSNPARLVPVDMQALVNELDAALENGNLHQALDIDKALRQTGVRMSGALATHLQTLRVELSRLLDWAKWGGNVSREEMINVAAGLLQAGLAPPEMAKQVGGLRARWKELDRTSGAAPRAQWERFDGACGRAYQVADAYFRQQSQNRADNFQLASALLAGLDSFIAGAEGQTPDWKAYQTRIDRVKTEWRAIGTIDRKLKTRLDAEFSQKIAQLNEPLRALRAQSMEQRRRLIQRVGLIKPADRHAIDQLKQIQQQWKQAAATLSLERREEQALWLEFRTACDAIFAVRQSHADQQKRQKLENQSAKVACCESIENGRFSSSTELLAVIRQAKQTWRNLAGQERQQGLEARFSAALAILEKQFNALLDAEKQHDVTNFRARIRLCQRIESACCATTWVDETDTGRQADFWQQEWNDLIGVKSAWLNGDLARQLAQRFDAALASFKSRRGPDTNAAASNMALLEEKLLRVELLRGLPSPVELAPQRLQLQVRDLQSVMKHRDVREHYLGHFQTLCALPVSLTAPLDERFQRILDDYCQNA